MSDKKYAAQRKVTKRDDLFKIYDALKNAGVAEGGVYKYKNGFSDKSVAESISKDVTIYAVQEVRRQQFGKLLDMGKNKLSESAIVSRLEELEELYLKLVERVDRIDNKLLESTFG